MQEPLLTPLPPDVEAALRDDNPWWRGGSLSGVARLRRWAFGSILRALETGLTPAVVLRGPRQVGKTTLLNQIIEHLLASGIAPERIFRVQFDQLPELRMPGSPILTLCRWYSHLVLKKGFHDAAHAGQKTFIFFDEAQNLPDWAPQLKHLVDLNPVRVLLTGSSAFRIEAGRDSLAGRISTFNMGPMLLREIAALRHIGPLDPFFNGNGLAAMKQKQTWLDLRDFGRRHQETRDRAFLAFSERGGHPLTPAPTSRGSCLPSRSTRQ